MITTLAKHETTELIQGPAGKLEIIIAKPRGRKQGAWGVVCHPHPLYGGTMHNKVVTTLAKTFQSLGLSTVRFNFRGVGQSEGTFDNGDGELYDLLAVIEWVLDQRPDHAIWLAGFSFGAYIAAKAATHIPVAKLVTVAPPVDAMQNLPPITSPWILVQGEKDEVVPAKEVLEWAEKREPKPIILRFPEASHFFHGQLQALREQLLAVLGGR